MQVMVLENVLKLIQLQKQWILIRMSFLTMILI